MMEGGSDGTIEATKEGAVLGRVETREDEPSEGFPIGNQDCERDG